MHRLRFFIQDIKYARGMEYVFAIGSGAQTYFKSLGLGWKVHPFCYCTKYLTGFSNVSQSTPQYIFVGSLSVRKNPISIVRAFSHCNCGNVKFIGDGELKHKLLEKIKKNYLQKHIDLIGTIPQNEIPSYLYDSDVLILPSLHDGWGAVVNEALHAGCFVLCSDACGSCTLLRKDSKLGIVFKAGSDAALADCMKYVNKHLKEIRANREYRIKWAETHIGGQTIAKYFVDCLFFNSSSIIILFDSLPIIISAHRNNIKQNKGLFIFQRFPYRP
jgi:glycosyltransferase involved in cell wall biosynthesis